MAFPALDHPPWQADGRYPAYQARCLHRRRSPRRYHEAWMEKHLANVICNTGAGESAARRDENRAHFGIGRREPFTRDEGDTGRGPAHRPILMSPVTKSGGSEKGSKGGTGAIPPTSLKVKNVEPASAPGAGSPSSARVSIVICCATARPPPKARTIAPIATIRNARTPSGNLSLLSMVTSSLLEISDRKSWPREHGSLKSAAPMARRQCVVPTGA